MRCTIYRRGLLQNIAEIVNSTLQFARRTIAKCKTFFDKYYLLANVGVYGTLYCLGDITYQTISHANTKLTHTWQRTKRMTIIGCTILPVMNTYFFRVLDKLLFGTSPQVVILKVAIDTIAWAPVAYTAFLGGKLVLHEYCIFLHICLTACK